MSFCGAGGFAGSLSEEGWQNLMDLADRQGVLEMLTGTVSSLPSGIRPSDKILDVWKMRAQSAEIIHETNREQCAELTGIFSGMGFRSCILKGEAAAQYYPNPAGRHCGDIDIWVDGRDYEVVAALDKAGVVHDKPLYQECKAKFFKSTVVEVHFRPQKMFNPLLNSRLQRFYDSFRKDCMTNMNGEGFCTPPLLFSLVHCMVHIFRHLIGDVTSLHQLVDCAWILKSSSEEDRRKAFGVMKSLGLSGFCADLMFALGDCTGLDRSLMICRPSAKADTLLSTVTGKTSDEGKGCLVRTRTHLKFLPRYPRELVWVPWARIWQRLWRMCVKNKIKNSI